LDGDGLDEYKSIQEQFAVEMDVSFVWTVGDEWGQMFVPVQPSNVDQSPNQNIFI